MTEFGFDQFIQNLESSDPVLRADANNSISRWIHHSDSITRVMTAMNIPVRFLPLMIDDHHAAVMIQVVRRIDKRYLSKMIGLQPSVVRVEIFRRINPKRVPKRYRSLYNAWVVEQVVNT